VECGQQVADRRRFAEEQMDIDDEIDQVDVYSAVEHGKCNRKTRT
jgi:hypothetical protein